MNEVLNPAELARILKNMHPDNGSYRPAFTKYWERLTQEFESIKEARTAAEDIVDAMAVINRLVTFNRIFADGLFGDVLLALFIGKQHEIRTKFDELSALERSVLCNLMSFQSHVDTVYSLNLQDLEVYKSLMNLGLDTSRTAMSAISYQMFEITTAAIDLVQKVHVDTKKLSTAKARENKVNQSKRDRATALKMYAELKIKNPKISKDRAAQELKKTPELKHITSVRTIRGYLPKA